MTANRGSLRGAPHTYFKGQTSKLCRRSDRPRRTYLLIWMMLGWATSSCAQAQAVAPWPGPESPVSRISTSPPPIESRLHLSEEAWKRRLTRDQYRILRQEGTERAFSHPLNGEHRSGTFHCSGCGAPLFRSSDKFDSRTGWPSFTRPVEAGRVSERTDLSHGMIRTEVECARCGGHLGHVFEDGPAPTGLRYCINGTSLDFAPSRRASALSAEPGVRR
ncbi:MAG: peptide-methionine (R)-S-oxide reductase MsrB [Myxococcota bacterium]